MKKYIRPIAFIAGILIGLYVLARISGILVPYYTSSTANEPNLKVKSLIWASRLKTPQRFDFICFKDYHPYYKTDNIYTYRLCGLAGDKIEIRDAVLYVNDENADKNLVLKHIYKVSTLAAMHLKEAGEISEDEIFNIRNEDSVRVFLSEKQIKNNNLTAYKRLILPKTEVTKEIQKAYNKDWNTDQFGTITVPKDHFFLLGDNRENAEDSRYWGFISKEKTVGTVLFKN